MTYKVYRRPGFRQGAKWGEIMTRTVTPAAIQHTKRELARLEESWASLNRPQVNKALRDSLYTKIAETRARLALQEAQMLRASRRAGLAKAA